MSLSRRILFASALALVGLWAVMQLVSRQLLVGAFAELEQVAVERKIERVHAAIGDSVDSLRVHATELARCEATRSLLSGGGYDDAHFNLTDAGFETLRLDLLLVLNERGERVRGRWRPEPGGTPADPSTHLTAALPDLNALRRGEVAADHRTARPSGLITLGGRPMLMATHPVLETDGPETCRGWIVLGRWLDGAQAERLSRLAGADVRVRAPGHGPQARSDAATSGRAGVAGALCGDTVDLVTGTAELTDVAGRPAATIDVSIPREIVAAGARVTGYFELVLTLACGAFTALLALWVHLRISRRITRLARVVDGIAARNEGGARVPVVGNDEIARLAANINVLLVSKQGHELKLAQRAQDLHSSRVLAESASRAKSDFLANMSHEIRTPMTAILGYADLLIGEDGSPAARAVQLDAVRTIQRNGEHLLNVINDILDLSKIEAGKMRVESLECSPLRVVSEVRELMALRAAASKLTVALEVAYPVPARIDTDPLRLRQILVNLVGNAIKFTPPPPDGPGRITIDVDAPTDKEGCRRRLRVRVTDTGVGIAEALRQRLFTPFSQHDASTTRKFGGTGLGLAISQQLAQMLGGSLEAPRPEPGAARGAVFELLLPIPDGATMLSGPEPEAPPASGVSATAKIRLNGRILLAEDGVDNQRLLQHVLRTAGAAVHLAENGTEAVAAARAAEPPFDLILMDMQMPEMDGYEATVALRQAGVETPIVALTAHAMAGDRERCLGAGCCDYLTKPTDRATLLATCERWMLAQRRAA